MPGSATNGTTIPIGFDLSQIVADARKLTASMNEITTSVNSFSDSVKTNFGQMAEAMKTINTTVESIAKSGFKELSDTVNSLDFKSTIDQMKELVELMGKIEIKQSAAGSKGGGSGGGSGSDEAKKQKDTYEHISMITKSITEDMNSQAKVIRGIASDGAAIVEVVDKAGDVIKQTKTTTDAQVIDAKNLLTTLKEQTAEMNKQKTLYVDMMKNPSALPSDQLAAQKAYEESRSKVTGTMNTINNATQIRDIISGVDSALASAQSKLDSAEAQVNRIMTSVNEATKQEAAQAYADKVKKATDNLNQQIRLRQQITQLELKGVNASKSTQAEYARLVNLRQQDLDALQASYATLVRTTPELQNEETLLALIKQYTDQTAKGMTDVEDAVAKTTKRTFTLDDVFEQIQIKLVRMATEKVFNFITDQIKDAVEYCTTFYDKLNEIRIVTGKTQEEADAVGKSFRDIAREMGVSSQDIAASGITYYRQGLDDEDVQKRLKATIEYAKAASVEAQTASEYITAATNALGIEAEHVADVYLYLADNAATSGK